MSNIDVIVHDGTATYIKTIDNTLEGFYEAIKCHTIEGYTGTELGHRYGLDIFLDGNGKIEGKQDTITGVFVRDGKVIDWLAGNVLICRHDDEGESTSATTDDLLLVAKHLGPGSLLVGDMPEGFHPGDTLLVLHC